MIEDNGSVNGEQSFSVIRECSFHQIPFKERITY